MDQRAKAERLRALHVAGEPLVLLNAWDAGSAAVASFTRSPGFRATLSEEVTYGGAMVSTWSALRFSCESRSPVGLVNPPGKHKCESFRSRTGCLVITTS